ncbi:MAG TPA: histidine kinase [Actinomycetota bacterium]|nr:histidine kinase [Actinomycetota bacterium]
MTSRAAIRATVVLNVVVAAVLLGGVALFVANRSVIDGNTAFLFGLFGAASAAYALAGTLIARRQSLNPIGWLFFALAFLLIAGMSATEYAIHAILIDPGSLPAPGAVLAFSEPTPVLFVTGLVLLLYLFPTGRPTGPRWRAAAMVTLLTGSVMAVVTVLSPHTITDIWSGRMSDVGLRVRDPLDIEALRGLPSWLFAIAGSILALGGVSGLASLFARRRGADAITREQLRWLAWVVGASAAWIAVMLPIAVIVRSTVTDALFWIVITPLLSLGVPIAVGIAILRYRLFDIDVVINRTFVFGALAAFITLVYVAVVVGVGQLVGATGRSPALSIIATAVVAVTFQPVRTRVQRLANRLVYGERATPYEVLGEFSERIGATYSSEELLPRMARILAEGTAATEASVWIEEGGRLRRDTSWPDDADASVVVWSVDQIEANGADLAVPVHQGGEVLGALSIRKRSSDPVTPTERALVERLASQAGLVLRNARLIEELRASRRRIVAAQDERAKKLERDIHDGAQQQLVALAVRQRLAASLVGKDDDRLRASLESLQAETSEALENLRDLARGIYPPLLADRGLAEALSAQARKAPVEVSMESDGLGRYPQEFEAAVYFCCLEALQNVAKYAKTGHVDLRLAQNERELVFEVGDDGAGFDPSVTPRGTGLQGMADRLDAIGGRLEVRSAPGEGTNVTGRVPLPVG